VGPTVGLDVLEKDNLLNLPAVARQFLRCAACSLVTILTELFRVTELILNRHRPETLPVMGEGEMWE